MCAKLVKLLVIGGFLASSAVWADDKKVLVHSLDVEVDDMFLMLTVTLPEERDIARQTLSGKLEKYARDKLNMSVVEFPALSPDERQQFDRAMKLFERVGINVRVILNPAHKVKEYLAPYDSFDYSIGSGASFLEERTGAQYILIYDAQMLVPYSSSTVAASGMRMDDLTYIYAALVELRTGRIVWFSSANADRDLRNVDDVDSLLAVLFAQYPASEYYKSLAQPTGVQK